MLGAVLIAAININLQGIFGVLKILQELLEGEVDLVLGKRN